MNKIAVITPVYEDIEASTMLFNELSTQFGDNLYVVAVDDGSVKQPIKIEALQDVGLKGVIIKLKRNVGHQRAIAIGIDYVSNHIKDVQAVVIMDSDGEDTPESIIDLLQALSDKYVDVVVSQRKSRVETLKFKAFYVIYKFLFTLLSGKKISFGNYMALTPFAVKRIANMQDAGLHVAATVLSSRLRVKLLPLDRGARYAGKSKMNFVGLVLHGFKGLMVFAEDVLVRVGIASALVALVTIIGAIIAFSLKLVGFATPGWFSIALGILFLVFIQTGTLTLMMLMLTGVVKNKSIEPIAYETFIEEIIDAEK
jgi:glycosyltransferase involved in cell wall biosynthesis